MSANEPITDAKGKKPAAGGKLQKWLSAHKPEAGLGVAAVGVTAFALLRRNQASDQSAAGSASGVPADATTGSDGSTAGGVSYDPAASDGSYDPISSVVDLQTSLDALATADAAKFAAQNKLIKKDNRLISKRLPKTPPKVPAKPTRPHAPAKKNTGRHQGPITAVNRPTKHKRTKK